MRGLGGTGFTVVDAAVVNGVGLAENDRGSAGEEGAERQPKQGASYRVAAAARPRAPATKIGLSLEIAKLEKAANRQPLRL